MRPRRRLILAAPPAECPRRRDGGAGPRVCVYTACPLHVLCPPARGPYKPDQLMPGDDFCLADISARGPRSTAELAVALHVSQRAVQNVSQRCIRKLARSLDVPEERVKTFVRRRG